MVSRVFSVLLPVKTPVDSYSCSMHLFPVSFQVDGAACTNQGIIDSTGTETGQVFILAYVCNGKIFRKIV